MFKNVQSSHPTSSSSRLNAKAAQAESQKRTYRNWINLYLQLGNHDLVSDLCDDLKDGIKLGFLIEALTSEKLPFKLSGGSNKLQMVGNTGQVLEFMRKKGVSVTCAADDIFDGNQTLILGLIWVLILKYQVMNKAELLKWIRERVEKKHGIIIRNFTDDWKSGVALSALIDTIKMDLIDVSSLDANDAVSNNERAFEVAATDLGIPRLLEAEDAAKGGFDDRSMMTYLSQFYNKFKDEEVKEKPQGPSELDLLREEFERFKKKYAEMEAEKAKIEAESQELIRRSTVELSALLKESKEMKEQLRNAATSGEANAKKLREIQLKAPLMNAVPCGSTAPEGDVTLVFTDVQDSTWQWEENPEIMAKSLSLHNDIMRIAINEIGGYEVKTEGDAFMVAFDGPLKAVKWAMLVQERLLDADWDEGLYEHPSSKIETLDGGELIWRGYRVRMGIHSGQPTAETSPVTGRVDYFGPMVNRSARVEGCAKGGQVCCSGEVWNAIEGGWEKEFPGGTHKFLGDHRLKGLSTDTAIHSIACKRIAGRSFPPLEVKTANDEKKESMAGDMDKLEKENEQLQSKLKEMEEKAAASERKARELKKWMEDQKKKFAQTHSDELKEAAMAIEKLSARQAKMREQMKETQMRLNEAKKRINELTDELQSSAFLEDALTDELATLQQEHEEALSDMDTLQKEFAESLKPEKKGIIARLVGEKKKADLEKKQQLLDELEKKNKSRTDVHRRRSMQLQPNPNAGKGGSRYSWAPNRGTDMKSIAAADKAKTEEEARKKPPKRSVSKREMKAKSKEEKKQQSREKKAKKKELDRAVSATPVLTTERDKGAAPESPKPAEKSASASDQPLSAETTPEFVSEKHDEGEAKTKEEREDKGKDGTSVDKAQGETAAQGEVADGEEESKMEKEDVVENEEEEVEKAGETIEEKEETKEQEKEQEEKQVKDKSEKEEQKQKQEKKEKEEEEGKEEKHDKKKKHKKHEKKHESDNEKDEKDDEKEKKDKKHDKKKEHTKKDDKENKEMTNETEGEENDKEDKMEAEEAKKENSKGERDEESEEEEEKQKDHKDEEDKPDQDNDDKKAEDEKGEGEGDKQEKESDGEENDDHAKKHKKKEHKKGKKEEEEEKKEKKKHHKQQEEKTKSDDEDDKQGREDADKHKGKKKKGKKGKK